MKKKKGRERGKRKEREGCQRWLSSFLRPLPSEPDAKLTSMWKDCNRREDPHILQSNNRHISKLILRPFGKDVNEKVWAKLWKSGGNRTPGTCMSFCHSMVVHVKVCGIVERNAHKVLPHCCKDYKRIPLCLGIEVSIIVLCLEKYIERF